MHACHSIMDMPACYHISMMDRVPTKSEMVTPGGVHGSPCFTAAVIKSGDVSLCDGQVALAKMLVNPFNGLNNEPK